MHISRNVKDKLSDKVVLLVRTCHANEQYSRRECLEISGSPAEVGNQDIEKEVLEILDVIDSPVNADLIEDCHRFLQKKVILNLNCGKHSRRLSLNKKNFKQLKPESLNWPAGRKIYVNGNLCPYYKKLWTKCRKL